MDKDTGSTPVQKKKIPINNANPIVGGMEGHARPKSKMGRDRLLYKSQMAETN